MPRMVLAAPPVVKAESSGGSEPSCMQDHLQELHDNLFREWARFRQNLEDVVFRHEHQQALLVRRFRDAWEAEDETPEASPHSKLSPKPLFRGDPLPDGELDCGDAGKDNLTMQTITPVGMEEVQTCLDSHVQLPVESQVVEGSTSLRGMSLISDPTCIEREITTPSHHVSGTPFDAIVFGQALSGGWGMKIDYEHASPLKQHFYRRFAWIICWWLSLQEPPRMGLVAQFVRSRLFEATCAVVIVVDSILSMVATDYNIRHLRDEPASWVIIVDCVLLVFYFLELLMKLFVHGLFFFCNDEMAWNLFDFALVGFSANEVIGTLRVQQGNLNVTYLRSIRIMRSARILRVVRVMRFFSKLRLILNSLLGSMSSLFWSVVMLSLIFYIFGLIFVQNTTTYLIEAEASLDEDERGSLMDAFGSVGAGMLTLYKASTGGDDWAVYYNIIKKTSRGNAFLFIFFVAFIHIALLNILTGIFVENAMKLAQPDHDTLAMEHRRNELAETEALRRLCNEMDPHGTGKITARDFKRYIEHGRLRAYLSVLGLHIRDAEIFFSILDKASDNHEVDVASFVEGCMRMKGGATSIDMQSLKSEVGLLQRHLRTTAAHCEELLDAVRRTYQTNQI